MAKTSRLDNKFYNYHEEDCDHSPPKHHRNKKVRQTAERLHEDRKLDTIAKERSRRNKNSTAWDE